MLWHHSGGAEPAWQLPEVPETHDDGWSNVRRRRWQIRTHNQEMAENSVDAAHFRYLHGTGNLPASVAEPHGPLLKVRSPTVSSTSRLAMMAMLSSASAAVVSGPRQAEWSS